MLLAQTPRRLRGGPSEAPKSPLSDRGWPSRPASQRGSSRQATSAGTGSGIVPARREEPAPHPWGAGGWHSPILRTIALRSRWRVLRSAVNGRKPRGLEITLDGAKYTRLIVSLDHPDAAKTALTA